MDFFVYGMKNRPAIRAEKERSGKKTKGRGARRPLNLPASAAPRPLPVPALPCGRADRRKRQPSLICSSLSASKTCVLKAYSAPSCSDFLVNNAPLETTFSKRISLTVLRSFSYVCT